MTQSKELDDTKATVGEKTAKRLRPSECRSHMRRILAQEFDEIVKGFVQAAKQGSCPHVKLATELLKPIRKSPSKKKGSVELYLKELENERREKDRLQGEPFGKN